MRILVIENEEQAFRRLEKLIGDLAPEKRIIGHCSTAKEALQWLKENPAPDLVISAVQLPDALSFQIFRNIHNELPVIFTCHLDKYALAAFKANGLHYLVKPIRKNDLKEALARYDTRFNDTRDPKTKSEPLNGFHPKYQERFIVHVGKQMKLIPAVEIAYFYSENKIVYLVTNSGEKYSTDFTLEKLEKTLSPKIFFRANRQYITNIASIVKLKPASKSRLELSLNPHTRSEIITSLERTPKFRQWLMGTS